MTQAQYSSNLSDPATETTIPLTTDALKGGNPMTLAGKEPGSEGIGGFRLAQLLLLTILPLALAPLTIESLVSFFLTQNRTQQVEQAALTSKVLLSGENISQDIIDDLSFAQLLAQNPTVYGQAIRGAGQAAADNLPALSTEALEARFGSNRLLSPSQEINAFLSQAAATENYAEVIITDANGFTVGYSSPTSDFVQSDETWWQQGKAQGQWLGELTFDESTSAYGFEVSQPIRQGNDGDFLGVLKVFITALEFEELSDLLSNVGIAGSQQVQILDIRSNAALVTFGAAGRIDYSTPEEAQAVVGDTVIADISQRLIEVNTGDSFPGAAPVQDQMRADFPVQNLVLDTVDHLDEAHSGERTLVVRFTYQDKQYALATVPQLPWVAAASIDVAEVQAAGRQSLINLVVLAIALGAVATISSILLSRRLATPLNDLSAKAQQVAAGNLNVVAQPVGSRETQTLASTFNGLVYQVRGFLREQILNTRRANLSADITGAKVVNSEDLMPVFQRVVEEARDIIGAERVVVYQFLPDWRGQIVAESAIAGLPSALDQNLDDPCIPAETRAKYVAEGILLENDIEKADFHPEHLALVRNLKVKSILGVPVVNQGQLAGLLIAHHCSRLHQWQDSEVSFMRQIGLQLGLVVERVKLLEQTQALAKEQQQLKEGLQRNALQLLMDVDPIRDGDLTVRAKVTEDEIGTVADSYNATIASLRKIVLQVQEAARQVSSTTDTNQISIRELSNSAAQQAGEILAALERVQDMANSVRLVATNAEKAELAVRQASETVTQGDDAMNRTVEGIMAIRETVADTAKKVKRLGESSQKISNVVNLISGFAAQTNMLALNASIEASRAGEGGKGFAVVAEEVRELARQSAEATTEIEKLVAGIQAETNAVVSAMEAGTEQVVTGTQLVEETRRSLNQITTVSRQISELVESIAAATVIQSQASEVVTETMNNVATTANQNSDAASQVSESFEQLRAVAQSLQEEVGRFRVS